METEVGTLDTGREAVETSANSDARLLEKRVQAMGEDEALARYHDLIDKRLMNDLDYKEVFELELIEARLDAEDDIELQQIKAVGNIWVREKKELVCSLKEWLSRLEAR